MTKATVMTLDAQKKQENGAKRYVCESGSQKA